MNVFEENPFFWSPSSTQINTNIIRFVLSDENEKELSIKHSKLRVSISMPVKLLELGQINDTSIQQHAMHYHKVRVERAHTYLELMLFSAQAHTAIFDIYFNNGDKPSPFNYTRRMSFTCNDTVLKGKLCRVFFSEHVLRKGNNYFGITMTKLENPSVQLSGDKSCSEEGQQKSSCVEDEDEEEETYYSLFVKTKRCLSWDINNLAWSTKGCWVSKYFCCVHCFSKKRCLYWDDSDRQRRCTLCTVLSKLLLIFLLIKTSK